MENVENAQRRSNSLIILVKMEESTGEKAVMWGDSLVGFGRYD